MVVDLEIIKDDLNPWYCGGKTYYFTDRWIRKYPDEAKAYYGFIPDRRHRLGDEAIKVYYTQDGELIISNCRDMVLQNKIRKYMENWYNWKKEQYIKRKTFRYPVAVLVREYASDLNDQFYQIRYKDNVCNIEKKTLDELKAMVYISTYKDEMYEVETGLETLDRLVLYLAKDCYVNHTWPLLTPIEWERYYYPGVESCFVPDFEIPLSILEYDAWNVFVSWGLPDVERLKNEGAVTDSLFNMFPDD